MGQKAKMCECFVRMRGLRLPLLVFWAVAE
jgi:hypothetical protein